MSLAARKSDVNSSVSTSKTMRVFGAAFRFLTLVCLVGRFILLYSSGAGSYVTLGHSKGEIATMSASTVKEMFSQR
jgi:hypothetical protein